MKRENYSSHDFLVEKVTNRLIKLGYSVIHEKKTLLPDSIKNYRYRHEFYRIDIYAERNKEIIMK